MARGRQGTTMRALSAMALVTHSRFRFAPELSRPGCSLGPNTAMRTLAMTKSLLYVAPVALVALVTAEAPAAAAAWSGSMLRNVGVATTGATDAPLVLVRGGGRGGGGGG